MADKPEFNELSDDDLSQVSGGIVDAGAHERAQRELREQPHDEAWKQKVLAQIAADNVRPINNFHYCTYTLCVGCGTTTGDNTAPRVCGRCRAEALGQK